MGSNAVPYRFAKFQSPKRKRETSQQSLHSFLLPKEDITLNLFGEEDPHNHMAVDDGNATCQLRHSCGEENRGDNSFSIVSQSNGFHTNGKHRNGSLMKSPLRVFKSETVTSTSTQAPSFDMPQPEDDPFDGMEAGSPIQFSSPYMLDMPAAMEHSPISSISARSSNSYLEEAREGYPTNGVRLFADSPEPPPMKAPIATPSRRPSNTSQSSHISMSTPPPSSHSRRHVALSYSQASTVLDEEDNPYRSPDLPRGPLFDNDDYPWSQPQSQHTPPHKHDAYTFNDFTTRDMSDISAVSTPSRAALPLPDQSAFNTSGQSHLHTSHGDSPQCPPTPERTPLWQRDDSSPLPTFGTGSLVRKNSLIMSKVLVSSSSPVNHSDVCFHLDFVNEGLIGSGTFADVYRARRKADNKVYAVKKSKTTFKSRRHRDNLLCEVSMMQLVHSNGQCPYVIQFVKAWQESGFLYVQLEFAERGTFRDLMDLYIRNHRQFSTSTIWRVMHDICCGLEHVHSAGVVHLDVKPQNTLISLDGTLKLCDFGIALEVDQDEDRGEGEGDPRYMAPELLNPRDRHTSADVFSFGLVMYETVHLLSYPNGFPDTGDTWHYLRSGNAAPDPCRPDSMNHIIAACLHPSALSRPTMRQILSTAELRSVDTSTRCEELMALRVRSPSPCLGRSASVSSDFQPIGVGLLTINTSACGESSQQPILTPTFGSIMRLSPRGVLPPISTPAEGSSLHATPMVMQPSSRSPTPTNVHGIASTIKPSTMRQTPRSKKRVGARPRKPSRTSSFSRA